MTSATPKKFSLVELEAEPEWGLPLPSINFKRGAMEHRALVPVLFGFMAEILFCHYKSYIGAVSHEAKILKLTEIRCSIWSIGLLPLPGEAA